MTEVFDGHIVEFYRGCPKLSGWFGCRFYVEDSREVVDLKGTVSPVPRIGARVVVEAERVQRAWKYGGGYEYKIIRISLAKDKKSVISYLCSLHGVGPVTAEKVWDAFYGRSLDVIKNEPEELKKIGLSSAMVGYLTNGVASAEASNRLRQEYPELTPGQVKKIVELYSNSALLAVGRNLYQLCFDLRGERGFDFRSMDTVALAHGYAADDPRRVSAAIGCVLYQRLRDDGDMAVDLTNYQGFISLVQSFLSVPGTALVGQDVIIDFIRKESEDPKGRFVIDRYGGAPFLYTRKGLAAEKSAAASIRGLLAMGPPHGVLADKKWAQGAILKFEKRFGASLDDSQRSAVELCLGSRVSILTGGPGTGKTATARCLAWCFKYLHLGGVVCLAPTNLAVRRLRELVSECVTPEFAETTARRAGFGQGDPQKAREAMAGRLVLIDEASMLSLFQAAGVLAQCARAHVVFLGDADQLPSIDSGDFFTDVIESGAVPVARLDTCHRAVGKAAILWNADSIRRGEFAFEAVRGVFEASFPETEMDTARILVEWYKSKLDAGLEPDKICILCPTRKHAAGAEALNTVIRDMVNPIRAVSSVRGTDHRTRGMVITGSVCWTGDKRPSEFRIGDRVVNLANRPGEGRVNGDVGYITSWYVPDEGEATLGVTFDGSCGEVEIDVEDSEDLALAYALTVHKSQGQEYGEIAVSLPSALRYSPAGFASRNLLYTAVTRAKDAVFLCGDPGGYLTCLGNARRRRLGRLRERLMAP